MSGEKEEKDAVDNLMEKLHRLEREVVPVLEENKTCEEIIEETGLKEAEVMRALQWLENKTVLNIEKEEKDVVALREKGEEVLKKGFPEKRLLKILKKKEVSVNEAVKEESLSSEEFNAALGKLKKRGCLEIDQDTLKINKEGEEYLEKQSLQERFLEKVKNEKIEKKDLKPEEKHAFDKLKKRGLVEKKEETTFRISLEERGKRLLEKDLSRLSDVEDRVTPKMLKEGSWRKKKFRKFDVEINVPEISGGRKHFVNEAIEYAKTVWLEMGFQEMKGTYVQTGFWNLDSLFVPQDHPAREMQDTFYLKKPSQGEIDEEVFERVKEVHEDGGETESKGWRVDYDREECERLMLRTHTTVLSAQTLYRIGKGELPKHGKHFVVSRNFRNESLDKSHLFEFHQVDGIVVDPEGDFKALKAYLEEFFKKMGFEDIRLRPAHFPYTEPSVEVEVYQPEKDEWIELGGAGIFRPEVTKTLIGEEVPVLAWGLGLERIIVDYFGIDDLRDLYKNDLEQLRKMKKFIKF